MGTSTFFLLREVLGALPDRQQVSNEFSYFAGIAMFPCSSVLTSTKCRRHIDLRWLLLTFSATHPNESPNAPRCYSHNRRLERVAASSTDVQDENGIRCARPDEGRHHALDRHLPARCAGKISRHPDPHTV